jgi:hypothetical protein
MRKFFALLSLIILIAGTGPAVAEIIYYENCENEPDSNYWRAVRNGDASKSFSVSSERAKAGKKSWKYEIGKGVKNSHNEHRFIGKGLENFPKGKEYWLGMSIFIPEDSYTAPAGWPEWGIGAQWHANPDDCETWRNPNLVFAFGKGQYGSSYQITIRSQAEKCGVKKYDRYETRHVDFQRGKWHSIVQHLKFGYEDGTAITQIWVDGKQIYNDTKANCFNDDKGFYFLIGPYTQEWALTMYIDEIKIGDSTSSYEEVAPSESSPLIEDESAADDDFQVLNPPTLSIIPESTVN